MAVHSAALATLNALVEKVKQDPARGFILSLSMFAAGHRDVAQQDWCDAVDQVLPGDSARRDTSAAAERALTQHLSALVVSLTGVAQSGAPLIPGTTAAELRRHLQGALANYLQNAANGREAQSMVYKVLKTLLVDAAAFKQACDSLSLPGKIPTIDVAQWQAGRSLAEALALQLSDVSRVRTSAKPSAPRPQHAAPGPQIMAPNAASPDAVAHFASCFHANAKRIDDIFANPLSHPLTSCLTPEWLNKLRAHHTETANEARDSSTYVLKLYGNMLDHPSIGKLQAGDGREIDGMSGKKSTLLLWTLVDAAAAKLAPLTLSEREALNELHEVMAKLYLSQLIVDVLAHMPDHLGQRQGLTAMVMSAAHPSVLAIGYDRHFAAMRVVFAGLSTPHDEAAKHFPPRYIDGLKARLGERAEWTLPVPGGGRVPLLYVLQTAVAQKNPHMFYALDETNYMLHGSENTSEVMLTAVVGGRLQHIALEAEGGEIKIGKTPHASVLGLEGKRFKDIGAVLHALKLERTPLLNYVKVTHHNSGGGGNIVGGKVNLSGDTTYMPTHRVADHVDTLVTITQASGGVFRMAMHAMRQKNQAGVTRNPDVDPQAAGSCPVSGAWLAIAYQLMHTFETPGLVAPLSKERGAILADRLWREMLSIAESRVRAVPTRYAYDLLVEARKPAGQGGRIIDRARARGAQLMV